MSNLTGKLHQNKQGNLGGIASSGGTAIFPAPPTGTIYILDWLNVLVRDATAATAYAEISIVLLEGTTPLLINVALVNSGLPTVLGTYSIFLSGLGLPVLADGASTSVTVTLRDVAGAVANTTITNGLIIGAWGLKRSVIVPSVLDANSY